MVPDPFVGTMESSTKSMFAEPQIFIKYGKYSHTKKDKYIFAIFCQNIQFRVDLTFYTGLKSRKSFPRFCLTTHIMMSLQDNCMNQILL